MSGRKNRTIAVCFIAVVALMGLAVAPRWIAPPPAVSPPQQTTYKVVPRFRAVDPNRAILPTDLDWAAEKQLLQSMDAGVDAWREAAAAMIKASADPDVRSLLPVLDSLRTISEVEAQSPLSITPQGFQGIPAGSSLICLLPERSYFLKDPHFQRTSGIATGETRADLNVIFLNPLADLGRLARAHTLTHETFHVYETRNGLSRSVSPGSALQSEMYAERAAWLGLQALSQGRYTQRHVEMLALARSGHQPTAADMANIERDFGPEWQDGRSGERLILHSHNSQVNDLFSGFDQRSPLDSLMIFAARSATVSSFQLDPSKMTQNVMMLGLTGRQEAQNLFARGQTAEAVQAMARAVDADPLFKTRAQLHFEFGLGELSRNQSGPAQIAELDALSGRWLKEEPYQFEAYRARMVCQGMLGQYATVEEMLKRARPMFPQQAAVWDKMQGILEQQRHAPH